MSTGPLAAAQVKSMAQRDLVLSHFHSYILRGWPNAVDLSFNPYSSRRHKLSVFNGCILFKNRIIIPEAERKLILDELYDSHQGVCHM